MSHNRRRCEDEAFSRKVSVPQKPSLGRDLACESNWFRLALCFSESWNFCVLPHFYHFTKQYKECINKIPRRLVFIPSIHYRLKTGVVNHLQITSVVLSNQLAFLWILFGQHLLVVVWKRNLFVCWLHTLSIIRISCTDLDFVGKGIIRLFGTKV